MLERGENWSLEYDDGVVIGRFERGMPLSAFEEEAYPAFERIVEEHETDIVATADVVGSEDALGQDVLEIWEQAARESSQLPDYERAALVTDGILKYGLEGQLGVPDAEIETFEDPSRSTLVGTSSGRFRRRLACTRRNASLPPTRARTGRLPSNWASARRLSNPRRRSNALGLGSSRCSVPAQ